MSSSFCLFEPRLEICSPLRVLFLPFALLEFELKRLESLTENQAEAAYVLETYKRTADVAYLIASFHTLNIRREANYGQENAIEQRFVNDLLCDS